MSAFDLRKRRELMDPAKATSKVVELEVESLHKHTIKPIVTQLLSIYTAVLIIFSFSATLQWLGVLCIAGATAIFNRSRDSKPINLKYLGIRQELSIDASDAVRWVVNISLADAPLTFLLGLPDSSLAGFWALVCISIIAETRDRRFRYPVFVYALFVSSSCIYLLNPTIQFKEIFFWVINLIAIGAFFVQLESYWTKATVDKLESQNKLEETIRWADELYRNASVAQHARVIAHEVANLAMGVNLITQDKIGPEHWGGIKTSVSYLQRVTRLVLDDLDEDPMQQICMLDDLISDVTAVLGRQITRRGIQWFLIKDPSCLGKSFVERAGSTYLIIQNLVKNATEAIQRKHDHLTDGVITLKVYFKDDHIFVIVEDNGHGFSSDTIRNIKDGASVTNRENGHGLGLRFVHNECRKNGFELQVGNTDTHGAAIGISIKVK